MADPNPQSPDSPDIPPDVVDRMHPWRRWRDGIRRHRKRLLAVAAVVTACVALSLLLREKHLIYSPAFSDAVRCRFQAEDISSVVLTDYHHPDKNVQRMPEALFPALVKALNRGEEIGGNAPCSTTQSLGIRIELRDGRSVFLYGDSRDLHWGVMTRRKGKYLIGMHCVPLTDVVAKALHGPETAVPGTPGKDGASASRDQPQADVPGKPWGLDGRTGTLLPGSQLSVRQAMAKGATVAAACKALPPKGPQNVIHWDGHIGFVDPRRFAIVDPLGGANMPKGTEITVSCALYIYQDGLGKRRQERPVATGETVIWLLTKNAQGASYSGLKALPDTPANRKAVIEAMSAKHP